ncbi:ABC transporter permease [Sunxiuqinia sp. sy24]|uniref:ABC transporter permease n=1 Tax=Sunxiuqinia sp. sy24 TaxID=3461495 RepID=UPI004045D678
MIRHYLKHAFRTFKANRLVFAGSIFTVSLCALCISLLFTYIHNELSMDDFHKREKDIYLLTVQQSAESQLEAIEANLFFGFNYKDYPGIENFTGVKKFTKGEFLFKYEDRSVSPEGIVVDSTFLDIFDFKLKTGDRGAVLKEPDAVLFTDRFAKRLFGAENPMGKMVKMSGKVQRNYTVKGIIEVPPSNSSITFDFILPEHSASFSRSGVNFILVDGGFDKTGFVEKIKNLGHQHPQFKSSRMDVMALDEIYNNDSGASFNGLFPKHGNPKNIYILFAIVVVIFVITLLNFSNLQIISINSSVKNIGINKISGASQEHVFYQKLTELGVLICLSAILISGAFIFVLPHFNRITGVELNPEAWQVFLLNLVILLGLVLGAMIYPSVFYLRISVVKILKNQILSGNKLAGRNVVATIQFTLSLILLIASIVVVKQLHLMLDKDLGFHSANIITTKLFYEQPFLDNQEDRAAQREESKRNFQYVINELSASSLIKSFTQGKSPINTNSMPWKLQGDDRDYASANFLAVTPDYATTLDLQLVEGRFFEKEKDKQREKKIVINEAAKKHWGIEDISSARILNKYWSRSDDKNSGFEILGVVRDFNSEHLSVKPRPLVMMYFEDIEANFMIRFEDGAAQQGVQFVQELFRELNPGETFEYSFLSDDIAAMYQKEKRLSEIYILFTFIAYLISSVGLFAISLYDTRSRIKEIGIRRVNGATIIDVMAMLNKDFVKWVTIAFVLACPIAWYAMSRWLENFAYKTTLSWWIFALAGILALGIALLTVSWQSWRAATRNPVEALRYE